MTKRIKTSIYEGVYKNTIYARKPWSVSITVRRKSYNIGYYEDETYAAKAYDFVNTLLGVSQETNLFRNKDLSSVTLLEETKDYLQKRVNIIKSTSSRGFSGYTPRKLYTKLEVEKASEECKNVKDLAEKLGTCWKTASNLVKKFEIKLEDSGKTEDTSGTL